MNYRMNVPELDFPASMWCTRRVRQSALILTLHVHACDATPFMRPPPPPAPPPGDPPLNHMLGLQEVSETSCQGRLGSISERLAASTKASHVLDESSWSLLRHNGQESATLTSPTGTPASLSCYRCGNCFAVCLLHSCRLCYSAFQAVNTTCDLPAMLFALNINV